MGLNKVFYVAALLVLAAGGAAAADPRSGLDAGLVNPGYHEQPRWFKQSFLILREDIDEAARRGRRLMVYFYQDGCPYCLKTLQDNLGQKALAEKTQKHFDVISINIWGDREVVDLAGNAAAEKEFAKALRIQFTPTFLMFDEAGKVVLRLNGYTPPAKFEAAVDFVGGKLEKQGEFADYLQKNVRVPASGTLHSAPWLLAPPLKLADRQKTAKRPLLVLFEQKECRECDELHADSFRRKEVADRLASFQVAQVDTGSRAPVQTPGGDTLPGSDWARRIGVYHAPTLVFFDSAGSEVFRVDGYVRPFHLASAMEYVASGAYRTQPQFQRYVEARAAAFRAKGARVDLMK